MGNIVIAQADRSASIGTVGNEDASFPMSNLLLPLPHDHWRSSGLSTLFGTFDFSVTGPSFDTLALLYTNATSAATIRWRGATSEANLTAAPAFDTGNETLWASTGLEDWPYSHSFKFLSALETHDWWRFDVIDGANPDGFFKAGAVVFGDGFQPGINYSFGGDRDWEDSGRIRQLESGIEVPRAGAIVPTTNILMKWATEAEQEASILPLRRTSGGTDPILIALDPDSGVDRMSKMYYGFPALRAPTLNRFHEVVEQRLRIKGLAI